MTFQHKKRNPRYPKSTLRIFLEDAFQPPLFIAIVVFFGTVVWFIYNVYVSFYGTPAP